MAHEISFLPAEQERKPTLAQRIWGWRKVQHTVGVEIDSNAVRVCYLHRHHEAVIRAVTAFVSLPPETIVDGEIMNWAALVEALRNIRQHLLNQGMPRDARACLTIYGHYVMVKCISIPEMTEAELRESMLWEAEQYIPFNIKDVFVDTEIINSQAGQGQMDILLAAAKKDAVNDYVSVFKEAGWPLAAVESTEVSLIRLLNLLKPSDKPDQKRCVLHVGDSKMSLVVACHQKHCYSRTISMGLDLCVEEILKELNVSWEEARQILDDYYCNRRLTQHVEIVRQIAQRVFQTLVTEVQRSLDFFAATNINANISAIVLCGPGYQIADLRDILTQRYVAPIEGHMGKTPAVKIVGEQTLQQLGDPLYGAACATALRQDFDRQIDSRRRSSGLGKLLCLPKDQKTPKPYTPTQDELARLFDTLAFALRVGIPIMHIFKAMASDENIGSRKMRKALELVRVDLAEGKPLFVNHINLPPVIKMLVSFSFSAMSQSEEIFAACARRVRTGYFGAVAVDEGLMTRDQSALSKRV